MMCSRDSSLDELLSVSWDKALANDLAAELERFSGEKRATVAEVRRFFAIKAHRDLLDRLRKARSGRSSIAALRSVAIEMRQYAVERPALWAAAIRTPVTDCAEWRSAYNQIRDFTTSLFAECGVHGSDADDASRMLKSLVRGFVLHEIMGSFSHVCSYEQAYEKAIDVFIAGVQAVMICPVETVQDHELDISFNDANNSNH
jgi:hypothetical protein